MENLQSPIVVLLCMLNGKVSYDFFFIYFVAFVWLALISCLVSVSSSTSPRQSISLSLSVSSKAPDLMRKSKKTIHAHTLSQQKKVQPALII